MVAVEHVLDLENTVNFDRHTSVLAPYCNCWEAPSAKSDPGSSQAASRGVEKSSEIAFRMAIEMKTCLAMVISGDRQHSASRREDAGEQAAKVSWVGWVGKGIQFVGVRGQLWKGCGSEVGFEEKSFLRVKEAEATSSGEHLHRHEGIQNKAGGSTQSTYRSARKSFVRRFASTCVSPAVNDVLRKHEPR
jgi:hypothetical protein